MLVQQREFCVKTSVCNIKIPSIMVEKEVANQSRLADDVKRHAYSCIVCGVQMYAAETTIKREGVPSIIC